MNEQALSTHGRVRDPQAKRAAILDAAEKLFSEQGFAACSMAQLAEESGVTQSLIHHHFGPKRGLWETVLRSRMAGFMGSQAAFVQKKARAPSILRQSMRSLFELCRTQPRLLRLYAWAVAEGVPTSAPQDDARPLIGLGIDWVRKAQERGELRADVKPGAIFALYFALCEHWFLARSEMEFRFGSELPTDEEVLDATLKIFLDGLRASHPQVAPLETDE